MCLMIHCIFHVTTGSKMVNVRWQTLGMVGGVTLLLVARTFTEAEGEGKETIRIISARKADRSERRIYEQGT